jgi:diguanylate cyclase (GGDEF)-like protein
VPDDSGGGPVHGVPAGAAPNVERLLRALSIGTTHLLSLIEADGTIAYAGPSISYLLGYDPDEVVGTNVLHLLHPDDQGMAISMLGSTPAGSAPPGLDWEDADAPGDYRLRHANGTYIPFEVLRNNLLGDPEVEALLVIARPIVARRALDDALSALAHGNDRDQSLLELVRYLGVRIPGAQTAFVTSGPESSWVGGSLPAELRTDPGPWRAAMSAATTLFVDVDDPGLTPELRDAATSHGYVACWCFSLPVNDVQIYSPAQRAPIDSGALGCMVVWSTKYDRPLPGQLGALERVAALAEVGLRRLETTRSIQRLLDHDQLTGALSRRALDRLSEQTSTAATYLIVDLDDFKSINDRHGHHAGDQVLRITAQRIQSLLRGQDALCRMGGDEFVLRLDGADLDAAVSVAQRIIAALAGPMVDDDLVLEVGCSLGIAPYEPGRSQTELMRRADAAMYAAKRAGKGRWHVWDGAGRYGPA